MSDNSTVPPSNLTSSTTPASPTNYFKMTGGMWFFVVSGVIDHALGIIANGWSLHVIVNSGGQRRSLIQSEIITLNLVAIEIVTSLCFILWLINLFFIKSVSMFKVIDFPYSLVVIARSLFQSLICLERYLAVVHPVVFLRYKPLRYRLACCGLVWMLAVVTGCMYGFIFLFQLDFTIPDLIIFISLLSIDVFCSLSILRVLRQPGPGDGGRERGREKKDEGKEDDGGREVGRGKMDGGNEEEQKNGGEEREKVKEGERAVKRGKERVKREKEEGKNQQKRRAFRIVSFMLGMLLFNYIPLIIGAAVKNVIGPQVFVEEVNLVQLAVVQMGSYVHALLHLHRAGRLPCLTPNTSGRHQNN